MFTPGASRPWRISSLSFVANLKCGNFFSWSSSSLLPSSPWSPSEASAALATVSAACGIVQWQTKQCIIHAVRQPMHAAAVGG